MSFILFATGLLFFLTATSGQPLEEVVRSSVVKVAPSIVRIETAGGVETSATNLATGLTSGVVVDPAGWIISSAYGLAHKPAGIVVTVPGPEPQRYAAKVIATDHSRKLTLLKIDASELPVPQAAPKDQIKVGQRAIAAGRTWNLDQPSMSLGIVSALGRIWGKAIQTDAKVSPVNYGGPLIDLQGSVLGILVPLSPDGSKLDAGVEWYDAGIGFAVPFEEILQNLPQLQAGDIYPGISGIVFKDENAWLEPPVIARLAYASPAEVAELKAKDKILAVEGQPVERIGDVRRILGNRYAGDTVAVEVERGSEKITKNLTLTSKLEPYRRPYLGIVLKSEESSGIIDYVVPESPAAKAGLTVGDKLKSFERSEFAGQSDLSNRLRRTAPGTAVTFTIEREEKKESVAVTLADYPPEIPASFTPSESEGQVPTAWSRRELKGSKQEYELLSPPEAKRPGLVIWFADRDDPSTQDALPAWQSAVKNHNFILIRIDPSSSGEWTPEELQTALSVTLGIRLDIPLDETRIVTMGCNAASAAAVTMQQRHPELVRGVILRADVLLLSAPAGPEFSLGFFVMEPAKDLLKPGKQGVVSGLRQLGYPVTPVVSDRDEPLTDPAVTNELGRWMRWLSVH